jgi:hypothetical protein
MSIWDLLGIGGPLALGVGGALLTIMPLPPSSTPQQNAVRAGLATVFIVVGIISAISIIIAQESHDRQTEPTLTGGDCFPTFGVIGALPPRGNGPPYPLEMFGGCANLYDVTYSVMRAAPLGAPPQEAINDVLHPIAVKTMNIVMPYAYDTGVSLLPGEYWIRVIARNGRTEEKLIVPESGLDGQIEYVQKETAEGVRLLMCAPMKYCEDHLSWAFPTVEFPYAFIPWF